MKFVSEPRCPSSQCLKPLDRNRAASVVDLVGPYGDLPRSSWPIWFEEIIRYKETNADHLIDKVLECPYCHLVWTQPENFDTGFRAKPKGYHRGNPDRLDPVSPGVQMKDPKGRMVAEGKGKRR